MAKRKLQNATRQTKKKQIHISFMQCCVKLRRLTPDEIAQLEKALKSPAALQG